MKSRIPRVAFLFTTPREEVISDIRIGQDADTWLHGLNYIEGSEYFVVPTKSMRSLWFLPRLLRYDFVVAQDNLLLGYAVSQCASLFRLKTRWLYLAMNSSMLMHRHVAHPLRLFFLRKFWESYAHIICLSHEQLEDFVRFGIARERLVFIPFGVDTHFFQPTDAYREEDIIVSVGRDVGRDYVTLFRAAEHSAHNFIVVAAQRNIPSGESTPKNVSVRFDRSLAEIRDLYIRAQLVVVVSKETGALGGSDCSGQTVILDALAAGKAVIATSRPWIADYFVPDQDVVVVEPGNPEALAQEIDSLIHDADRRKRLAASGHAKVAQRYTTAIFAASLLQLMRSVE